MNLNLSELKELFELIAERNITEFELEEEGVKLRIKQGGSATPALTGLLPGRQAPAASAVEAVLEPADEADAEEGVSLVTAPMVGTFYLQPEPGAEPFARKGDRIKKGQILCIIEAMKLMNEIESDLSGELVAIYVENGQPVQYGDKLFAIRES
ncbi:MAG: acetyl-CoA carboxylase biotin carboxyl carrier protein [Acidobacteria bacterium]|nr:MAG: acetyl-CoA carboxylase biotin carboxyl carrier protein [Acidobacteriota bacterium]